MVYIGSVGNYNLWFFARESVQTVEGTVYGIVCLFVCLFTGRPVERVEQKVYIVKEQEKR